MAASDKISVIIPTIQKNLIVLNKLLGLLSDDNSVSEIIVINNVSQELQIQKGLKKIRVINPETNLYVNASWNLGVKECKNDLFLLINDDILPVKNFCSKILESGILDKKITGLVGINPEYISQYDRVSASDINVPEETNSSLSFLTLNRAQNTGDWGSAIFGRKSNYYEIPSDIKIIFGDNFLLNKNLSNAKINYQITGLPFNHIHSLSSAAPEFGSIIAADIANSRKYLN